MFQPKTRRDFIHTMTDRLSVIPYPNFVEKKKGNFVFSKNTEINFSDFFTIEKYVKTYFDKAKKLLKEYKNPTEIVFRKGEFLLDEQYIIDMTEEKIEIISSSSTGALYGFSTLRQILLLDTIENGDLVKVGLVRIEDRPKMKWRGLLLDPSRHFISVKEVKEHLDMMALLKLNVMHFHLNDNQGFRIEIKKYPLLTEIGSKRKDTALNSWDDDLKLAGTPHSGYYTQEEIKDIVSYASMLGITVVPEIDSPAHFYSVLSAYPNLSCTGKKVEVPASMGGKSFPDWNLIMCAGKQESYDFLYDVLDEICTLFPAPYVHIGGDEAPKANWKKCPDCQRKMKEEGLKNEEDLQGYLINCLADHLAKKGKRIIGWNEILKADNLRSDAIVQYWTVARDTRAEKFMKNGGDVIVSRNNVFYFDMCYSYVNLKKVYDYTPEKYGISGDSILGLEATLWSEFLWTRDIRNLKLYPRLPAFSEVAWTDDDNKNYLSFYHRFYHGMNGILDKYGIMYAEPSVANPKGKYKLLGHAIFGSSNPNYDYDKNLEALENKKNENN